MKNAHIQDLSFKDFKDLKQKAYEITIMWMENNFNEEWRKAYIKQIPPSSYVWIYKDIVELYRKFIQGSITKEQGESEIDKLEYKFIELTDISKHIFDFQLAMKKAFKKSKKEYGEVTFDCPFCRGTAYGIRMLTPNNIAHKVTIRGGCHDCGHSVMN